MDPSLLAVRDINHKYIVVERKQKNEENYFCIKTTAATDILFKIQSPEWEYGTRNLDSVAWQTVSY